MALTNAGAGGTLRPVATRSRRLDDIDRRLLVALSRDGRRPAADLAKELGLSRQSVTERLRALETDGVVRGYRADVDPAALGLTVRAHVRLTLNGSAGAHREKEMLKRLEASPLVRTVHRVSGEDCFVIQIVCRRIEDVAGLLRDIQGTRAVGSSRTAFVLETLIDKTGPGPLDEGWLEPEVPA
jgi:Lrp/AsnC family transcriptional regulator, leucine-responsive regulatory protein